MPSFCMGPATKRRSGTCTQNSTQISQQGPSKAPDVGTKHRRPHTWVPRSFLLVLRVGCPVWLIKALYVWDPIREPTATRNGGLTGIFCEEYGSYPLLNYSPVDAATSSLPVRNGAICPPDELPDCLRGELQKRRESMEGLQKAYKGMV